MKIALSSVVVLLGVAAAYLASQRERSPKEQPAIDAQALETNAEAEEKSRREREQLAERLANCEVWIGMTYDELIASWGKPQSSNSTESASGIRYQFVFERTRELAAKCGNTIPDRAYVYVENDVVEAIQKLD